MTDSKPVIAVLGGTGSLGLGLARNWLRSGYRVLIGSRTQAKADEALAALRTELAEAGVTQIDASALDNVAAAEAADVVAMAVPFAHHRATLESVKEAVQGKIFIDVTVPLVPPKVARVQLPPEGSAGLIAQAVLGENVRVVSAFQNVAATHLQHGTGKDCDVLVCGDNKEARAVVVSLVEACGMRGFHAGSIANSAAVEALTSVLIFINKNYSAHAGIRITGVEGAA